MAHMGKISAACKEVLKDFIRVLKFKNKQELADD